MMRRMFRSPKIGRRLTKMTDEDFLDQKELGRRIRNVLATQYGGHFMTSDLATSIAESVSTEIIDYIAHRSHIEFHGCVGSA